MMVCGCGHEEKMEIPLDNFFFWSICLRTFL
jgi:hypothetical protein